MLADLVSTDVLDAELAALLWLLGERGVPLVVASRQSAAAEAVRAALVEAAGPAGSTTAGGTLFADSLDEAVRLAGASAARGIPDELRDLGVVVVVRAAGGRPRVVAAHYIRPLERDAGGHVQRRGPAVLAAWDERRGRWEHFAWAVIAELAARAGLARPDFDRLLAERVALLEAAAGAPGRPSNYHD